MCTARCEAAPLSVGRRFDSDSKLQVVPQSRRPAHRSRRRHDWILDQQRARLEHRAELTRPLPAASLHIRLALLGGELHGYALMRRVGELRDGAVKMGPGTLYGTLNRLVDDTLISETTDRATHSGSERRRYYELTPKGRAVSLAELARLQTLVHRVAGHLAGGAPA